MREEAILKILEQAGKLKVTTRHCYLDGDRKESVADHTFRTAFFAMLLRSEEAFRDVDMDKVIRMCLIHDLGESFTGDIPAFDKTDAETAAEDQVFYNWVKTFPEPLKAEFESLLFEMDGLKTKEARVYKALDKMEALISHDESDRATWLPLEFDLQLTYGQENMKEFPYLASMRKLVDEWTVSKREAKKDRTSY